MSRTKRKDQPIDNAGTPYTFGPAWKATLDRKKHYKPGKGAKVGLHKGRKAKTRAILAKVVENPDDAPMPREPKSDQWYYN